MISTFEGRKRQKKQSLVWTRVKLGLPHRHPHEIQISSTLSTKGPISAPSLPLRFWVLLFLSEPVFLTPSSLAVDLGH